MSLCDPMDYSTPGLSVPHHLLEFVQVHVHWISDATQPSHPLLPSSFCFRSFPASGFLQWVVSSLQLHRLQHSRLPCPLLSPRVCSSSCPLSQWCHLTILSSVTPFSLCLQCFSASGSFPMSWLFASGGQSIGVSVSASVLPVNIQDWFPLGLTGWISLLSKGLSRVFSSNTIWRHQFFGA